MKHALTHDTKRQKKSSQEKKIGIYIKIQSNFIRFWRKRKETYQNSMITYSNTHLGRPYQYSPYLYWAFLRAIVAAPANQRRPVACSVAPTALRRWRLRVTVIAHVLLCGRFVSR
jgi:hypothetical protein